MKVRKSTILKWTAALRSGKYKQITKKLQDENGFCCLGVACKVFKTKEPKNEQGMFIRSLPGVSNPNWLRRINVDFDDKMDNLGGLANLNDNKGASFDEIADLLEAIYVHEVLKS